MDSPIFGSQKSYQHPKSQKYSDYSTNHSELNPPEWYAATKNTSSSLNSQISMDLKLAYTLLIVEKNLKTLLTKIKKCINKKKNDAFCRILAKSQESDQNTQKGFKQLYSSSIQNISNPQTNLLSIACCAKINQKLQNMCRIINTLKFKKLAKAWSRLYIMYQKNHFPSALNEYSSCVESDLEICSKIEAKKRLNSKTHAKEMKENSIVNHTNSDIQADNEKLAIEIMTEEKRMENFTEKMNVLLSPHESYFAADSDRETLVSDNGFSLSSLQKHIKPSQGGKNHGNKKR